MVIAMIISYLPWYNFSAVLKYISQDFGLTASDTGMIISAFQAGYVLVVLITGWLADKIGPKKVVLYATLLTGIFATAFVFVVSDFKSVLIMRLLTGCAAGAIYAPGMSLLSNWFAPNERAGALGAYTGALTAASAGGYFVAAPLAASYDWQTAMLWTSIPVFIAAFIIWKFVDDHPPEGIQFDGPPELGLSNRGILKAPEGGYAGPVTITAGYMGHMWELYAFWGWIGPFMVANAAVLGMASDAAVKWGGLMAACITLVGAPAVWIMGIVADKIGRTKAIILAATCSLVAEFFFGGLIGKSLVIVVAVGMWIGFWVIADSAIYKAGLTDMVNVNKRSTFLGLQSAIGYSMTIIAPMVFGKILEIYNPGVTDPTQMTIWAPAFIALGIGALVAPAAALILRRLPQAKLMTGGKL